MLCLERDVEEIVEQLFSDDGWRVSSPTYHEAILRNSAGVKLT